MKMDDHKDGSPGLAQLAMDVVEDGSITFYPARYKKTYLDWLGEKRDWCISRQLWWGHRIPVWESSISTATMATPHELDPTGRAIDERISNLKAFFEKCQFGEVSIMDADWEGGRRTRLYVCGKDARADDAIALAQKIIAHTSTATTDELREYTGFRTEVKKQFGDDALALKHGKVALAIDGKSLSLVAFDSPGGRQDPGGREDGDAESAAAKTAPV